MAVRADERIHDIGFVLLPGFALMSFAAASEPYRAANILAERALYRVRCFGETCDVVQSSSGAEIPAEPLKAALGARLDTVMVCAGGRPSEWDRPAIHAALRRLALQGVRIGGISGGPYVLAAAGLLKARDFTIHWEHAAALIEAFPELRPRPARFVIDRDRLTCGGGVTPLDMAHALIAERLGSDFARRVSDWFLHTEIGASAAPQRASLAERYGVHHPALLSVIETMEATVEAPLGRQAMAELAGISVRQLDRLFAAHRGTSFGAEYKRIRLAHAARLLRQSALSVAEIAFATGFASPAHFSRAFRMAYGHAPSAARRRGTFSGVEYSSLQR
ncbi:GlxA family transcriptional regulator [Jiella sonneratiae]|uniref:GlxA family transcriptional regulator n=1 Tax=Jiella sonneratiae TaxID=2816856 RepID=A0ABS3J9S1_9HYPH|nr:GlxA family transcriptional regulator [Jiella sonneratiae]MBO0906417.1 GlxA family transcriptional regulator [Jiella sonneratiae]